MKYSCTIDNAIFDTKNELVKHLLKKYSTEFEEKRSGDVEDIYNKLKKTFPDWNITIKKGEGWYADFVVNLELGNKSIAQYIGNYGDFCYKENPNNVDEAIKEIAWKIKTMIEIENKVKKVGEFEYFNVNGFEYGYSGDEHHFIVEFRTNEFEENQFQNYYPGGDKHNNIDEFVNDFKQFFLVKVEGSWSNVYDCGYFTGYSIDGVNIDGLLHRAKKVRLEIIE